VLQGLNSTSGGQYLELAALLEVIERVRFCEPPLHFAVHPDQAFQAPTLQSGGGHAVVWFAGQGVFSTRGGHSLPPAVAGRSFLRSLFRTPPLPHVCEQSPQELHELTVQFVLQTL
jgi:hypothetical protein